MALNLAARWHSNKQQNILVRDLLQRRHGEGRLRMRRPASGRCEVHELELA
jgi:hypothetical protein